MAKQASKLKGYDNIFAQRLRDLMKERHVTQDTLAEKAGCSRQAISQYMDGSSVPNVDKLLNIADYFDVSVDYLIGRTEAKTTDRDIRFVCDYTGLDDVSIQKLHRNIGTSFNICNEIIDFFLSEKGEIFFAPLCKYFDNHKQCLQEFNEIKKKRNESGKEEYAEWIFNARDNLDLSEFHVQKQIEQLLELYSRKKDELLSEEDQSSGKSLVRVLLSVSNKKTKSGDENAHNPETQ